MAPNNQRNQLHEREPVFEFSFTFETDYGLEIGTLHAKSHADASKILRNMFPDDCGSDGYLEGGPDGLLTEQPINW